MYKNNLNVVFVIVATQTSDVRLAKVKVDAEFNAPCDPSILYPADGGNMHWFTAVTACAVLDVLGPPYSDPDGRHCTYYQNFPFSTYSGIFISFVKTLYEDVDDIKWFESFGNFSWWNIHTRGRKENIWMATREGGTWKSSSSGKDVQRPKDCGELTLFCHPTLFLLLWSNVAVDHCLILFFEVIFLSSSQTCSLCGSTTILVFHFLMRSMRHLTAPFFIFGSFIIVMYIK